MLPLAAAVAACSLVPAGHGAAAPQRSARVPATAMAPAEGMCLAALGTTGARFTPLPDRYLGAGCSNLNTVRIEGLRGDRADFALANLGPVTCQTAQSFAAWARFGVDRAARQILGSPLVRIDTMGSYSCRNIAGSAKRSAHARAEAIDIAAFVLADGRRISVADSWSAANASERQFLRVVHDSACKRFGTVLGPDYNAAHKDHFHLEHSGGGFCR